MVILIGPSASGKTELGKRLEKFNIKKVVTYTTRNKRNNEKDDIDYHFISKDMFKSLIEKDFFYEYIIYNDNYYGTSKASINDNSYVILEPEGFLKYKDNKDVISFFINVPKEILESRMLFRGDDLISIKNRLKNDSLIFNDKIKENVNYILDGTKTLDELVNFILKVLNNGL